MDQKQLTDVTYVLRDGRSLLVNWKRVCVIQWIRISMGPFPKFRVCGVQSYRYLGA